MDRKSFLLGFVIGCVIILVLSLFNNPYSGCNPASICASNPINELVTSIQKAQSGLIVSSSSICMSEGSFDAEDLSTKITGINSIIFECGEATVCQDGPLTVYENRIVSEDGSKFKAIVSCEKVANSGNYDCNVEIRNS